MGVSLRVLLVSHVSGLGGAERSLLDLVHGAAAAAAQGDGAAADVRFTAALPEPGPLADALAQAGARVVVCDGLARLRRGVSPRQVGRWLRGAAQVARLAARDAVDVVHANSASAGLFCFAVARPLVWHVRDLRCGAEVSWLARRAAAAIAPSLACRSAVARRAPDARVELIPNGVDLARGAAPPAPPARPTGALASAPSAVVIGHLAPWKRHDLLLEAVALLRQAGISLRVNVVGGDPFGGDEARALAAWRARVGQAGLVGAVEFVGPVDEVSPWLAGADLLLHPAYPEPFGRVIVEALAAGLPVVAFDGPHGPAEIVQQTGGGWLAAPLSAAGLAGAIGEALRDPAALSARGRRAMPIARALYRREQMAARVLALCREVGAAGSRTATRRR
jgi:glycosyltransferase involved in cell wall biosynthesis